MSHSSSMSIDILLAINATPTPPSSSSSSSDLNASPSLLHPHLPNFTSSVMGTEGGREEGGGGGGGGPPRPQRGPPSPDEFMMTMMKVQMYGDPVIFTVGMMGNVLAYLVFTRSKLRKVPSVPYLAGIAVADSGFLLTCFLTTLTYVYRLPIMSQSGVCQFGSFANFVCLFLVMWYVVAAMVEKLISVYWPLKKVSLCTVFRAKVVLVSLAVLAIVSYSYIIYFFGPDPRLRGVCRPWQEFRRPYQTFMLLDCIVVFIVPLVILLVFGVLILVRGCEYYRISSSVADFGPRAVGTSSAAGGGGVVVRVGCAAASSSSSSSPATSRATEMILALAGLVLVTHLPNSLVRIAGFFQDSMDKQGRATFIRCSSVVRQIHLLSFAIKFLVYWVVSRSFREHTKNVLWGCKVLALSLCALCVTRSSSGADPQRISLRGCGGYRQGLGQDQGHYPAAKACLIQSDV